MPGRKTEKARERAGREGTILCIHAMTERIEKAASLAAAASALAGKGRAERAFEVALDIEPLLHEANHLLQAASALRRMGGEA